MKKILFKLGIICILMFCTASFDSAKSMHATAHAQETAPTKNNVEIYPQIDDEHHFMICMVNQIYYDANPYDKQACIMGAAPGAPSVLQIPSSICVNGVNYAVTKFDSENMNILGLPSEQQIFEEIKLPDSVVDIKLHSRFYSESIKCKKINIPKHTEIVLSSLVGIDIDVDDTTLVIPEDHDYYALKDNFVYDKKNPAKIHCVLGVSGNVRIPDGITYVGSLLSNSKIEELSLPSTLEELGESFAESVDQLKILDLSKTKLKKIPESAFQATKSLQEIKFPSTLCLIDYSAFEGSGLKEVVIPNKVTKIRNNAFYNCRKLKKVTLGKKLKIINKGAFSRTAIQKITIPESVKKIEADAFEGQSLRKITFMHKKKMPKFTQRWTFKYNRSGIKLYVKNRKMAKQLRKNLKKSKIKVANIYAGKKKKPIYKYING